MPPTQDGARHPGKGYGLVRQKERGGFSELFELVKAHQADFPVRTMCRTLRISASGYYAWLERPPSARHLRHVSISERIHTIHAESDATYGSPRVQAELRGQGEVISRKLVAKLMRRAGLHGVSRRRGFTVTTRRDEAHAKAPDLVKREFVAETPNQLWVADMTYIPTWAGFIYLAVVLDVWSRKVVGWSIGERMRTELVMAALNMALDQRRPQGVIHHSDQGSQYTSVAFGHRCEEMGVRPSMGTVGDAYDNAMAESFFASLECELLNRRSFQTKIAARLAVFTWIEGWYNPRRRHSALGYLSPQSFEEKNHPLSNPSHSEHGLPTGPLASGLRGASGGPVDNPARSVPQPA